MRKLIALTFVTLDGVMQAPGGPEEDEEEFPWVSRLLGHGDERCHDRANGASV
jgi:hypothetical protein